MKISYAPRNNSKKYSWNIQESFPSRQWRNLCVLELSRTTRSECERRWVFLFLLKLIFKTFYILSKSNEWKSFVIIIVTYLSLVDEADDSPLEFFGEFPAINTTRTELKKILEY